MPYIYFCFRCGYEEEEIDKKVIEKLDKGMIISIRMCKRCHYGMESHSFYDFHFMKRRREYYANDPNLHDHLW